MLNMMSPVTQQPVKQSPAKQHAMVGTADPEAVEGSISHWDGQQLLLLLLTWNPGRPDIDRQGRKIPLIL